MNTNDLNTALYEKMAAEQDKFRDWLKSQPPEEILHHTYEYTVREDIVMAMEELELTDTQAQALLESPSPLTDVYRYFEKLETGYMGVIRDSIESRANDVCRAKEELRTTPVYPYSAAYASEHGEMAQYNLSYQANSACKEAIEQTISAHYAENRLDTEAAVKDVLEKFGMERVQFILANTIQRKNYDGRISQDNKAWAKSIPTLEDSGASRHCAYLVVDQVNPGLTDLFTRQFRKVAQEQQKSSVCKSSNRSCPPISLPPEKNGSRSDNHGKAQAGCSGFVLGVRRRTGADPSKDAAIRDREFERLSAENGTGWVCGQTGSAGAEGVGFPDAPKQQQLESADPQSA